MDKPYAELWEFVMFSYLYYLICELISSAWLCRKFSTVAQNGQTTGCREVIFKVFWPPHGAVHLVAICKHTAG